MNLDVWLESHTWYSWPRVKVHQTIASCLPIAPYIVTAGPLLLKPENEASQCRAQFICISLRC